MLFQKETLRKIVAFTFWGVLTTALNIVLYYCFRKIHIPVQVSTILDNAGPLKSTLDGNVKIAYRNGKIVATIDPKTGNVTHINYYYVWELDVTVAGNNVNAPFGIESDFTINW